MQEATFGPDWGGPLGTALKTLAEAVPQEEADALLTKSLISPLSPVWRGTMPTRIESLVAGGATRQASVHAGLESLIEFAPEFAIATAGRIEKRIPLGNGTL